MDEVWERAVEAALDGQEDSSAARSLTLDGAVKCIHGRLPPHSLLEKFQQLRHLSIASVGVSSLADFPRLKHLEKLILSDNRIAGGLEFLVQAGLESLRDLDLSNNKIQYIEDLAPLAQLKLVSLDLYECPVTRVADYRERVFGLIKTLKYLDKADAEENERPESDEEEEDEEDEDDVGSGEVEGEGLKAGVGPPEEEEDDDSEESDEEEEETVRFALNNNDLSHARTNGINFGVPGIDSRGNDEDDEEDTSSEEEDVEDEEEEAARFRQSAVVAKASNFGAQVHEVSSSDEDDVEDEDEEEDVENVQEVQDVDESDDDDDEDEEDDDEEDVEEVDLDEDEDDSKRISSGQVVRGNEVEVQEIDEEDENGELGEEDDDPEEEVEYEEEEVDEEEEDYGTEYLVQPVRQAEDEEEASDFEPGLENGEDEDEDEDDDEDDDLEDNDEQEQKQATTSKRKRDQSDETDDSDDDERPNKR